MERKERCAERRRERPFRAREALPCVACPRRGPALPRSISSAGDELGRERWVGSRSPSRPPRACPRSLAERPSNRGRQRLDADLEIRRARDREHAAWHDAEQHRLRALSVFFESSSRELADRLQHPVALDAVVGMRRRTRLLSSSEASASRSASQTASAASSVQPAAEDRRGARKHALGGVREGRTDQAIVARKRRVTLVRVALRRQIEPLGPAARGSLPGVMSASFAQRQARARGAAGRGGRRARRLPASRELDLRRSTRPRSTGTARPPLASSGGDRTRSRRRSGAARGSSRSAGARGGSPDDDGDRAGHVREQLLEVVEHDVRSLSPTRADDGRLVGRHSARAARRWQDDELGRVTGANGMKTCLRPPSSASRRASSIAKRVFPVPPGPTIVRTRGSRSSHVETASNSSRSRPRNARRGRRQGSQRPACGAAGNVRAELRKRAAGRRSP